MDFQEFYAVPSGGRATQIPMPQLIVDGAIEGTRAPSLSPGWEIRDTRVRIQRRVGGISDSWRALRDSWLEHHRDEISERKLSLRTYTSQGEKIRLSVQATEWSEVQPIHEYLRSNGGIGSRLELIRTLVESKTASTPNIVSIHGIVETADEMLVLAQRSEWVEYHPLHWCASFEEQLSPEDLAYGDAAFHAAAARGVNEELFPAGAEPSDCALLAVVIESAIANPAIVAYLKTAFSSGDLMTSWRKRRDRSRAELKRLRFVPLLPTNVARLIVQTRRGYRWHPTSRYRLLLAMSRCFGNATSLAALEREMGKYSGQDSTHRRPRRADRRR